MVIDGVNNGKYVLIISVHNDDQCQYPMFEMLTNDDCTIQYWLSQHIKAHELGHLVNLHLKPMFVAIIHRVLLSIFPWTHPMIRKTHETSLACDFPKKTPCFHRDHFFSTKRFSWAVPNLIRIATTSSHWCCLRFGTLEYHSL